MTDIEIRKQLKTYFTTDGKITIEDGLVSCTGDVVLRDEIPVTALPVKFKSVGGNFHCSNSKLTTLAGVPQTVDKNFVCTNNPQLTTLEGAPQIAAWGFNCSNNALTSLAGAPQSGPSFSCSNNKFTSLKGAPQYLEWDFECINNPLTSLAGAPRYVGRNFYLTYNKNLPLLSLLEIKGCQQIVFVDKKIRQKNLDLSAILKRYLGKGNSGMLACAEEMHNAGYGSNAYYD